MDMRYRIGVVIVNYRTSGLTLDCVRSVAPQLDAGLDRIVVVDNASGAGEADRLSSRLAESGMADLVTLVPLSVNCGFSAGNNAGIVSCDAEYYLLANSDTVFMPGAVERLLQAAIENPEAGIVSPRLVGRDGTIQVSCFHRPSPLSETIRSANTGIVTGMLARFNVPVPASAAPSRPDWTSFACVLVRRAVVDSIGLLDDGFFMYYEDVDYCRRARAAGFDIVNWPAATVVHLQGGSSDVDERAAAMKRLPLYYYQSRARYFRSCYGRPGLVLANVCWLAGRAVSIVRQALGNQSRPVPRHEFINIWKGPAAERNPVGTPVPRVRSTISGEAV